MAASCLSVITIGVVSGALGPALPELAGHSSSSLAAVGAVITALFVGSIFSLLGAGPLFDRFGQYPVLFAGAALFGLGTLGLTLAPTLPLLLLAAGVAGLGHGAIDIGCNVLIGEVFAHRRGAALNLLNVFFGVGAVLGPAAAALTLRLWHSAMPALWLGGGLTLFQFWLTPRLASAPAAPHGERRAEGDARGLSALMQSPSLWMLGGLMLTYVGIETGMSSWTTTYLSRTTAPDASVGALVSAGFWLALAGGRMTAALAGARFSPKAILAVTLCGALAATGLQVAATGHTGLTILAVLLIGFFFGPVFPSVFAITTGSFRGLAGTAGSLVVAMGSTGAALLPWLQGVLLANVSPAASVSLTAAGAVVMLLIFGGYHLAQERAPVAVTLA